MIIFSNCFDAEHERCREREREKEKEISHVCDKFMMIVMRHQKHSLLYFDHSFISHADNKCHYMLKRDIHTSLTFSLSQYDSFMEYEQFY